jgi:serine/threonine-protein kinase RsbW
MPGESLLRLKAVLQNVPDAIDFVTHSARAAGFNSQGIHEIQVAVDEACANIVQHAYAGMEAGDMEISCHVAGRTFVVRVHDWGKSFSPDDVADPDVDAPLEERILGGLGLFFIRQFMDEVRFSFDPILGNALFMSKVLPTRDN